MRICLISDSPASIPAIEINAVTLEIASPSEPLPQADMYIWDYVPGLEARFSATARPSGYDLILAGPSDLESLAEAKNSAFILLKPVNPHTFGTFLRLALETFGLREEAREVDRLRLDRDTLLQYALEVNLKLQAYDQDRGNFLARGIHDFRTPLTALHGYCGLLAEEKLGPVNARQQELLERMRYSAQRLTRMARGMISLLTQGRFETTPQYNASDIGESLNQALHDVNPFIKDKNIEVKVNLEPSAGTLRFEAEQIQQVFINLLENSSKFVPRDGRIEVRGYPIFPAANGEAGTHKQNRGFSGPEIYYPEAYQVDISDSGPGVPAHLAERIFEQYCSYRGSGDRSGGGLGLAICKLIVNAHGGVIWATPSQTGARFSFRLPFKMAESGTQNIWTEELLKEDVAC